jgi:hypothetical protein
MSIWNNYFFYLLTNAPKRDSIPLWNMAKRNINTYGGKIMLNKLKVPKDVTALCEQVAKGYERRKKSYEQQRMDIIYRQPSGGADFVGGHTPGRNGNPTAFKAERLLKLENGLDMQMIRAVDEALLMTGTDVSRDSREKLRKALLLNCEDGKEFPFEVLGLDGFSRSEFYRRKRMFIAGIGAALGLVEV